MKILVLEDFKHLHDVYADALGDAYNLHFFEYVKDFKEKAASLSPDFVIYDLQLKEGFLFDLLKPGFLGVPFMVVSSNDDEEIIKEAFGRGAVDFLVKPFSNSELKIKIERVLSKFNNNFDSMGIVCNNIPISLSSSLLSWKTFRVDLTPKESLIMKCLLERFPENVTRDTLSQILWAGKSVGEKTVNTHLYNLRMKLTSTDISLTSGGGKIGLQIDSQT